MEVSCPSYLQLISITGCNSDRLALRNSRGIVLESVRSRGILIKASHGEIAGNRIEGCSMSAILVSPEYSWLEAASRSDLRITPAIPLQPAMVCLSRSKRSAAMVRLPTAGVHRKILITDNTVTGCAMPGIRVTSTIDLGTGRNPFGDVALREVVADASGGTNDAAARQR